MIENLKLIKKIKKLDRQYNWGQFCWATKNFAIKYDAQDECDYPPMIIVAIPYLFSIYYRLKRRKPESKDFRQKNISYGFYFFNNSLVLLFGQKSKHIDMPWALQFTSSELLDFDLKTVFERKANAKMSDYFKEFYRLKQSIERPYPFTYVLKNGTIQNRTAKVCIERRTWSMNWFRWVKKVSTTISIDFDEEVGEKSGSWKGGCTGCNYDLLDNETPEQALRRLESQKDYFND